MSLEGLNSLIQLESTRLEGARQTTSNSQQVNQSIQSMGLSTSSNKVTLSLEKINATFNKECQEAEVRKIERKLARERSSQQLAMATAVVATACNLAGNIGDAFKDVFGAQKLGDIPKSLQVQPINPGFAQVFPGVTKKNEDGSSDSTAIPMYMAGPNSNGSETVYSFKKSGEGTIGDFTSATITDKDKRTILGPALYKELSDKNGKNPPTFQQINAAAPEKAALLMADKCHGIAKAETDDFMKSVDSNPKLSDVKEHIAEGLKSTGKLGDTAWEGIKSGAKTALNVLVNTVEQSMPYFQAFLAAKQRADNLYDELIAAKSKLAAASKKLHDLELSIEKFSQRGA